jgi:TetR/AcrR family transcriptional repressor of nem operon
MARPRGFDENVVLDRAVDVFWRQGYESTAIGELCSATELNPGSIYAAFGDKRGLFVAALKRYAESVSAAVIVTLDTTPSGEAAIRSYFAILVDGMVHGRRRWGCLVTNTLVEQHAADKEIAALIARHLAKLEAAFVRALGRDGAVPADAAERAGALVCFVLGLNVMAKSHPGRAKLEALVSTTVDRFARPLKPRSRRTTA